MKRPTHIFVRLSYRDREDPVLSVMSFAEHPTLSKWISKYGTDAIAFPSVPYEGLSDALPSFWGEMRRYAFCSIAEFFKAHWTPPRLEEETAEEEAGEPAEAEEADTSEAAKTLPDPFCLETMLRGKSVVFHPDTLDIEWVDPDDFDDPYDAVTGLDMNFRDILNMIRILKPDDKELHEYFDRKIKYHMDWRRKIPSKLVCHFDNARDNEDDEIDSSYLDD